MPKPRIGGEPNGLLQAQEGSFLPGRQGGEKGREGTLLLREKGREEAMLRVAATKKQGIEGACSLSPVIPVRLRTF
jgi:hypothetical protein